MIIGTAGHVDHGKTSLVRALTGVDTDRLAEEKARGISIELGFAYTRFDDDPASVPIGFIDVPGHRKFVQTMIAGAAGIDVGLLVVAADDGPMPQTREHLDILAWLGVPRLVVALTKVDAVDDVRRGAAMREVRALVHATRYADAPIHAVSVLADEGLPALTAALRARGDGDASPAAAHRDAPFRLAIDRAFVLQGIGLVVTGTCFAGRVAEGDVLKILPNGLEARVRSIHAQNESVAEAHAGQRVALNLAGRGIEKSAVHRGDWAVDPALAFATDRADVLLLPAAVPGASTFAAREWKGVRFHAAATSINARVVALAPPADANESGTGVLAQIAFERPIHLVAGDRFVLRDASVAGDSGGTGSAAGGFVLDVDVPPRGRRSDARLAALRVAARGDVRATLAHAVATSAKGVDLARFNLTHGTALPSDAVPAHVLRTGSSPPLLFATERWSDLKARVVEALGAEHARAPDAVGPGRDRLRRMATPFLDAAGFTSLVDELKTARVVAQTGAWLHLAGHRVVIGDDEKAQFVRIRAAIAEAATPGNPPRVREIAAAIGENEAAVRSICVRFASRGALYRIAHDHYFLPATVASLARTVVALQEADGVARAAPFRDRIGVGRKVAIQILEFFDRVGFTRRAGDDHRVRQPTLFDE